MNNELVAIRALTARFFAEHKGCDKAIGALMLEIEMQATKALMRQREASAKQAAGGHDDLVPMAEIVRSHSDPSGLELRRLFAGTSDNAELVGVTLFATRPQPTALTTAASVAG